MLKKNFLKLGAFIGTLSLLLPTQFASAVGGLGTGSYMSEIQQGGAAKDITSLPTLIGRFIGIILSVLGILLVVYIVQAGILYMTAGGDTAKVDKAKKMITTAIIGMIIIVAAYSISNFVIGQLTAVATG